MEQMGIIIERSSITFRYEGESKSRTIYVWEKQREVNLDDEQEFIRAANIKMVGGGYETEKECKGDIISGQRFVGQFMRQIIFSTNIQETIKQHIELQREYNGSTIPVELEEGMIDRNSKYDYLVKTINKYADINHF